MQPTGQLTEIEMHLLALIGGATLALFLGLGFAYAIKFLSQRNNKDT